MRLTEARRIVEDTFTQLHPGQGGRWVELTGREVASNPELAQELLDLVNTAYAPIGGHVKLRTPADIARNASFWMASDIDSDAEPDVVSLAKKTTYGLKSVGMGHDGSRTAKDFVLTKKAKSLNQRGNYAEMSGAIAHIMLKRHGAPSVNSQEEVERVLGKQVEWVGAHPDGKYPRNPGWYVRDIAGQRHMKILLGMPL